MVRGVVRGLACRSGLSKGGAPPPAPRQGAPWHISAAAWWRQGRGRAVQGRENKRESGAVVFPARPPLRRAALPAAEARRLDLDLRLRLGLGGGTRRVLLLLLAVEAGLAQVQVMGVAGWFFLRDRAIGPRDVRTAVQAHPAHPHHLVAVAAIPLVALAAIPLVARCRRADRRPGAGVLGRRRGLTPPGCSSGAQRSTGCEVQARWWC